MSWKILIHMRRAEAKDTKALFPRRAVSHNGYYVNFRVDPHPSLSAID